MTGLAAKAQQSGQMRRLAVLIGLASDAPAQASYAQFLQRPGAAYTHQA